MNAELEPVEIQTDTVKCDGGGLPLGHPRVYLNLKPANEVVCPYCSQRFILGHTSDKKKRIKRASKK